MLVGVIACLLKSVVAVGRWLGSIGLAGLEGVVDVHFLQGPGFSESPSGWSSGVAISVA